MCTVPPIDAEHNAVTAAAHRQALREIGPFVIISYALSLSCGRFNRDFYGGERGGEPVWGEE